MTLPYSFSAGQTAVAAQVNADFVFINDRITTTASALQTAINAANNLISTIISTASYVPTGTVIWFPNISAPEGYLICNGAAASRTDYADLFSVIGVTFGEGDGETTFNLPNLSDNRFIEGHTTVGTAKSAGLPNITGSIHGTYAEAECIFSCVGSGALYPDGAGGQSSSTDTQWAATGFAFDASRSSAIYGGSSTVQPKSLTLLPCIKY